MTSESVLTALLVITLVAAAVLVIVSTAMIGRKLTDLEHLEHHGDGEVARIQAWINLRTHLNRVFLGVSFVIIMALLLLDAPIAGRTWSNRILFALLMLTYTASSLLDWRAERKQVRLLMAALAAEQAARLAAAEQAERERLTELQANLASYRQIAETAVESLEQSIDTSLAAQGRTRPAAVAAVLPEHQSPVTPQQAETADLATLRGRLVAADLSLASTPLPVAIVPESPNAMPVAIESVSPGAVEGIVNAISGDPPHVDAP